MKIEIGISAFVYSLFHSCSVVGREKVCEGLRFKIHLFNKFALNK